MSQRLPQLVGKTILDARILSDRLRIDLADGSVVEVASIPGRWPIQLAEVDKINTLGYFHFHAKPHERTASVRVPYEQVVSIQSEDRCTVFTIVNDPSSMTRLVLQEEDVCFYYEYTALIDIEKTTTAFLRVHRNALINPYYITGYNVELDVKEGKVIYLTTRFHSKERCNHIRVSRRNQIAVRNFLEKANLW